jgi:hypothetical protein
LKQGYLQDSQHHGLAGRLQSLAAVL